MQNLEVGFWKSLMIRRLECLESKKHDTSKIIVNKGELLAQRIKHFFHLSDLGRYFAIFPTSTLPEYWLHRPRLSGDDHPPSVQAIAPPHLRGPWMNTTRCFVVAGWHQSMGIASLTSVFHGFSEIESQSSRLMVTSVIHQHRGGCRNKLLRSPCISLIQYIYVAMKSCLKHKPDDRKQVSTHLCPFLQCLTSL